MRTKIKLAIMTLALGLSAWSVAAQDGGGPPPDDAGPPPGQGQGPGGPNDPGGGRHRRPLPPIITALDTNHDGVIDAAEIANASAALMTLDKNGDGKLTLDELMGPRPHPDEANAPDGADDHPRPPLPLVIAALDANHDGVIDASEIANASAVLLKLDKNGDGKLTMLELMGPRPRRGGRGPGGPDGQGNPGADGPPGPNGPPPGPDGGQPPPGDK